MDPDSPTEPEMPGEDGGGPVLLSVNKDVDVLVVMDNSGTMGQEQGLLAASFESFVSVLERPGVDASYRIGITTTDDGNPWCSGTTPEAGALQMSSCRSRPEEFSFPGGQDDALDEACLDQCPEQWSTIETLPTEAAGSYELRPRRWLENIEGQTNLPEGLTVTQAFQCVGPQGISGCGFESPLESMWKALTRSLFEDDYDFGFVRDNSVLSIIHVTDEADCSRNSDWDTIFLPDGNRIFWSDPMAGTPTSAVCWNAGVACSGAGTYDDCFAVDLDVDGNEVSAANAPDDAVLRPLSRYIDLVQEYEDQKQQINPDQEIVVAVLGGVGRNGTILYQDSVSDPQFQDDFGIGPGCSSPTGDAVPLVRLAQFAEAFQIGGAQSLFSICAQDYGPALQAIAESIADQLRPACMPACVADTDPTTPETVDPQCALTQTSPRGDGSFDEIDIPPCIDTSVPDGADVCYQARVGDQLSAFCDDQGFNLQFDLVRREGVPAPAGTTVEALCQLSQSKETDCPDLP